MSISERLVHITPSRAGALLRRFASYNEIQKVRTLMRQQGHWLSQMKSVRARDEERAYCALLLAISEYEEGLGEVRCRKPRPAV